MTLRYGFLVIKMNLKNYIDKGYLITREPDKEEISKLLKLAERDLQVASKGCHDVDWQFAIAYNAALQLASVVLRASGYRATTKTGHHWITLTTLPDFMGKELNETRDYFNACRTKRNFTEYCEAGTISQLEAERLIQEVKAFKIKVVSWLKKHHPKFINS
jgi:uncharacterized protein (UPF0332 family)